MIQDSDEFNWPGNFVVAQHLYIFVILVDFPHVNLVVLANAQEAISLGQVPYEFDSFSMHSESAEHMVESPDVQNYNRTFAHSHGQEFLHLVLRVPNRTHRSSMHLFVEDLSVKWRDGVRVISPYELHRSNALERHGLLFRISYFTLLHYGFQQSSLLVDFVDANRTVRKQHNYSVEAD